jgi:transcriptional regulator with XRE-family HTH domain
MVRSVDNGSEKAAIGRRIQTLIERRGLSKAAVAGEVGATPKTVSNWAKGASAPSYEDARELARVLGSSAAFILTGEHEPERPERGQLGRIEERLTHIELEQRKQSEMLQSQRQAVDAAMAQALSAIAALVRRVEGRGGSGPGTPPQSS